MVGAGGEVREVSREGSLSLSLNKVRSVKCFITEIPKASFC